MTRLGDLLQTQPLINALHSAGYRTGLLALENFGAATGLLRDLDYFAPLPGARLRAGTDGVWSRALEETLSLTGRVRAEFNPDYIINLTPTLSARLLSKLIAGDRIPILGFGLDEFGYGVNSGVWASFFAAAAQKRGNSPFNVADMTTGLGVSLINGADADISLRQPDGQSSAWAKNFLSEGAREKPGAFVGFQLGASEERRRWPVKNFSALGDRLWQDKKIMPVLLGSTGEKSLGEEYGKLASHPFINAVGATDLPRLAALLRETRLLVTNDTGTMHLASGVGVPSLAFFMATAQPWDTGPLLPGCCCLEPGLDCHPCSFGSSCQFSEKCRETFRPDDVANLVYAKLEKGDWRHGVTGNLDESCRVWETCRDEDGRAALKKIAGANKTRGGAWTRWQRRFWGKLLDAATLGKSSALEDAREDLPPDPVSKDTISVLREAASVLESARECGALASRNPQAGKLLLRNCERAQILFEQREELSLFAAFWREFRQSQAGRLDLFLKDLTLMSRAITELANALEKPGPNG